MVVKLHYHFRTYLNNLLLKDAHESLLTEHTIYCYVTAKYLCFWTVSLATGHITKVKIT